MSHFFILCVSSSRSLPLVFVAGHFEYITKPYEQKELEDRLSQHLGHPYNKSEGIPLKMDMVGKAIENCKKRLGSDDNIRCFIDNPSTTVAFFVSEIVKEGYAE